MRQLVQHCSWRVAVVDDVVVFASDGQLVTLGLCVVVCSVGLVLMRTAQRFFWGGGRICARMCVDRGGIG